jgi:hypothetical protein
MKIKKHDFDTLVFEFFSRPNSVVRDLKSKKQLPLLYMEHFFSNLRVFFFNSLPGEWIDRVGFCTVYTEAEF